jgi:hypothetical protein
MAHKIEIPTFFDRLRATFRKPKVGEVWGYAIAGSHPWEDNRLVLAYIKDVKGNHVCYTNTEERSKMPCDQWEDNIHTIKTFKSMYMPMPLY